MEGKNGAIHIYVNFKKNPDCSAHAAHGRIARPSAFLCLNVIVCPVAITNLLV